MKALQFSYYYKYITKFVVEKREAYSEQLWSRTSKASDAMTVWKITEQHVDIATDHWRTKTLAYEMWTFWAKLAGLNKLLK